MSTQTHRHIWKDEGGPYVCLDECGASLPVTVVDEESASQPGDLLTVVGRFATEQEAVVWLGQHPEQDKVARGGFGVDVPEEDETEEDEEQFEDCRGHQGGCGSPSCLSCNPPEPCCYTWYRTRHQQHDFDCSNYR